MDKVKLTLPLKKDYAMQILAKNKQWEACKFNPARDANRKIGSMQPGDFVAFHWYSTDRVRAKVEEVRHFSSISQMLQELGTTALLPSLGSASKDEAVDPWI